MEIYYMILIGILFILAFSDLIVGVSNDAVNFLNSALGSKAGSFNTIMIFAALGILFGAVYSSGMMEVARKGIFHPEHFYFNEIMIIFMAVMLADIILLDLFNTFGMPTSTTVSIVFELLGAAVGMALIKIYYIDGGELELGDYINTKKALAIISGILLSVVASLIGGAVVQYFVRVVFTFNYQKTLKRYGAIWGAISFTGIMYFILIKGIKGASFMTKELKHYIMTEWLSIVGISFVVFLVLFFILQMLKVNILKVIVLVGTFALATAFASNDLVNFIGVPMAAYNSYQFYIESGVGPDAFSMAALAKKVPTDSWMLLASGLIMVLALRYSKKARSVTETELNLGRQEEGYERFGSNIFARVIVLSVMNGHARVASFLPKRFNDAVNHRFEAKKYEENEEVLHFDLLRASVNILMAGILISIGTSMKLPLSTTYVTFMVAMGTSLADKAWGRESAVYRVSGVMTVIGGWFFTAFLAFSMAFIIVAITYFGGKFAVFGVMLGAVFFLYQTHFLHKKRSEKKIKLFKDAAEIGKISSDKLITKSQSTVATFLSEYERMVRTGMTDLANENRRGLKVIYTECTELYEIAKEKKHNVSKVIDKLTDDSLETGFHYVQVTDYLRELSKSMQFLLEPSLAHIENSHKPLIEAQKGDLADLTIEVGDYMNLAKQVIENNGSIEKFGEQKTSLLKKVRKSRKRQIRRIKAHEVGTRNSMLYLAILAEMKNIGLFTSSLVNAHGALVESSGGEFDEDS